MIYSRLLVSVVAFLLPITGTGQDATSPQNSEDDTISWLIDAAGPKQRMAIQAVYTVECGSIRGTGFLLREPAVLVTNAHVTATCPSSDLVVRSYRGQKVQIRSLFTDANRDIALLKPLEHLQGGLEIGEDKALQVGRSVTTWGFPLTYGSGAPLLTVGYVSGFNSVHVGDRTVKHIVVNGAFNPGNSGGPLFLADDTRVLGIVVWKQIFLKRWVKPSIDAMLEQRSGFYGGTSEILSNGQHVELSDAQVTGNILAEFYNQVQVVIGEAVSASELKQFIKEKQADLK